MLHAIGAHLGFTVDGWVHLYDTEPEQPPKEDPYGYGVAFTPYRG